MSEALKHAKQAVRHHRTGRFAEAEAGYRRALRLKPDWHEVLGNLGAVLVEQGRSREGESCCRAAIQVRPGFAEHHLNLSTALLRQGRFAEAEVEARKALELQPAAIPGLVNLSTALLRQHRILEAEVAARQILEQDPGSAEGHFCTAEALQERNSLEDAVPEYLRALALRPQYVDAYVGMAQTLRAMGRIDDAIACCRQALEFDPDRADAHAGLLFNLGYSIRESPESVVAQHRRWGAAHADRFTPAKPTFPNSRNPERVLRVGYVSADFRRHAVAYFFLPVLESHDRTRIHPICYSNGAVEDDVTARFRTSAGAWRRVTALDDDEMAELVRKDEIDVLVDLSGHTTGDRLLAFARKPAPVQVSWLGYFHTTGMKAMDYLLADSVVCPPEETCSFVEQPVRLEGCYLSYRPFEPMPESGPAPVLQSGRVTYGCFNNAMKLNPAVIRLWARILEAQPDARLALLSFSNESGRKDLLDAFAACGIPASRLAFVAKCSHRDLLRKYGLIDIALDPFPYNGGTTTCEAVWMGVPVITLRGDTFLSRVGATILTHAGMGEFIADSAAEYVEIALRLGRDTERLAALRATLRDRLVASPLSDTAGFTRNLEQAYRTMWRRFCAGQESQ